MDLYNILLKESWKDKNGNVLSFIEGDTDGQGSLIMLIDGSDCSEGVEEKVLCDIEDIKKAAQWYGYYELAENLEKSIINIK